MIDILIEQTYGRSGSRICHRSWSVGYSRHGMSVISVSGSVLDSYRSASSCESCGDLRERSLSGSAGIEL
jgi:hypothetical protein